MSQKPLIKSIDMPNEMASEAMEIITMNIDKYQQTKNYEAAAQAIKTNMDKKYGASWHCCVGEGYGCDVTFQARHLLYAYYTNVAIIVYKC